MSKCDAAIMAMTETDIKRFEARINRGHGQGPDGECHEWTAGTNKLGYGVIGLGSRVDGSRTGVLAHRAAYFLEHGVLPPPDKPLALHTCDNPPCCRGEHLFAGSNADNANDKAAKGRGNAPRGDDNGSRIHPGSRPRGENCRSAKLNDELVREMRAIHKSNPNLSYTELGRLFGVSRAAAKLCVLRLTWAHVE